jgi:hypothetical protein
MFMLSGEAAQARAAYAKLEVRPRSAKARTEVQGEDGVRLLCHAIAAAAQGDQGGKDKGIGREAQRCLQRALTPQRGDMGALSATQRWLGSYLLAVLHQRAGDPAAAAEQFQACLAMEAATQPDGAAAFCRTGLAGCLQEMGMAREALDACEAAARSRGASTSLLFTHATLLAQVSAA